MADWKTNLLEAVIRCMPEGVIVAEAPTGRVLLANDSVLRILGSEYELGSEWPVQRVLAGEIVDRQDIVVRGETTIIVRCSGAPIRDEHGAVVAAVVTFFDVTTERRERDALILLTDVSAVADSLRVDQTLERIASLTVPKFADLAAVHLADESGNLTRHEFAAADPRVRAIASEIRRRFPLPAEAMRSVVETGRSQLVASVPREIPGLEEDHRALVRSLGLRSAINVAMRATGRTWGVMSFARIANDRAFDELDVLVAEEIAGQCAIALERASLFESERRAREEAERASRAKDEFLAILSHELRTPMTTVIGWADFLKMTHAGDAELIGPIDALRNSARVQAKLVDDLLDVSRIVTGKLAVHKRAVELTSIVRGVIADAQMAAREKGVHLSSELPREPLHIHGDPDRVRQIVSNLLVNGLKFTPRGGLVTVIVRDRGDDAEIVVRDTGEGISPEFLPHVFDRFRQGSVGDSRRHSGLGLGLSIVQYLVERHGGTVHAESDGLGRGACFSVRLPRQS